MLGVYEHYKGNRYELIGIARHSETREELVVYRGLLEGDIWVRPKVMFFEEVEVDGVRRPRFMHIEGDVS